MRCRICACVAWAVRVCVWAHVVGGCGWQRPSCKHPLLSHYHPTAVSALLVYIQCCARKHHPYMLPSPGIYFRSISYTVNNKIAFRHRSLGHSRGGGAADPRRGEPQIACCRMASAPPSFPSAHAARPGLLRLDREHLLPPLELPHVRLRCDERPWLCGSVQCPKHTIVRRVLLLFHGTHTGLSPLSRLLVHPLYALDSRILPATGAAGTASGRTPSLSQSAEWLLGHFWESLLHSEPSYPYTRSVGPCRVCPRVH